MFVTPLLLVGALAVDVSAHERRAQGLQNTADAAALAGASAWTEGGTDRADQVIADIVNQNGHGGMNVVVEYPAPGEVTVRLTDPSPPRLLAITPGLASVTREATAQHRECQVACSQTITVDPPLRPVAAASTGDGFLPIPVGERYYAVNHHSSTVMCVDKSTNLACWPERPAFDVPNVVTMNVHHPYVIGSRIYYLGVDQDPASSGELLLGCFDTATDTRCPVQHDFGTQGHGTLAGTDQGLFVLTSSRKVFCFDPVADQDCLGYIGGNDTFLAGELGWTIATTGVDSSDRIIHDDKIYHSIETANGTFIQCWDITTANSCEPFRAQLVSGTDLEYQAARRMVGRHQ